MRTVAALREQFTGIWFVESRTCRESDKPLSTTAQTLTLVFQLETPIYLKIYSLIVVVSLLLGSVALADTSDFVTAVRTVEKFDKEAVAITLADKTEQELKITGTSISYFSHRRSDQERGASLKRRLNQPILSKGSTSHSSTMKSVRSTFC